ncbi:MAG: phytoene desaturase family protein [Candidatus Lernaella stagnicola]|nr:phytoene desaturase family protein [Candidatus Lernaella stagnicola]
MSDYDVIVIGGGNGGVTAASLLAKQGRRVLLLEQGDRLGGCCSTFEKNGYKFDIGASIVEALEIIGLPFSMMDTKLEDEIDMISCDPIYDVAFQDGTKVSFALSTEKTVEALRELSPADAERYPAFLGQFADFIDKGGEDFFTTPLTGLADLLAFARKRPVMAKYLPIFLKSYEDVIRKYFKDEKVLQTVAYQSFYAGHPPDLTPGMLAIIPATEHRGISYPTGGMGVIPAKIAEVGGRFGLEVQLGARVARILLQGRTIQGVVLSDGSEITAPIVVSNINAKTLYLDLIGEEHLPWLARHGIKSYEPSMTCPMMYLGLDYKPPVEAHHTIFPLSVKDMDDYWWNGYRNGFLPAKQFGLICCPTLTDPSLAPKNRHIINLTLAGPYHLHATDWDEQKESFQERVIDYLDAHYLPDLKKHVCEVAMTTPLDFERRLLHPGGAIYGLQQDLFAQALFRPSARSRSIHNLYLAGASTHPGGGVPTTIGSGVIAAELIAKDHA